MLIKSVYLSIVVVGHDYVKFLNIIPFVSISFYTQVGFGKTLLLQSCSLLFKVKQSSLK